MARGHFFCGVGAGIVDALFALVVADLTRGTGGAIATTMPETLPHAPG
jgi:hypothetical protein